MAGHVPPRYPAPLWVSSRRRWREFGSSVSFVACGVFLTLLVMEVLR